MIMFDKGFSVKNCFVVFSCIFSFSLQMQAQEDVYARLDVLTRMATLCRSATGKAAVSHSDEVMQELKAALDSLDTYRVTGTLESCILTDMIRCGIQRKDTLLVLHETGHKQLVGRVVSGYVSLPLLRVECSLVLPE